MSAADVLIIGAGPAGLNAAYALEQAGIEYRLIERTQQLAPDLEQPLPLAAAEYIALLQRAARAAFPAALGHPPHRRAVLPLPGRLGRRAAIPH